MNKYAAVHAVACKLYNTPGLALAGELFPGRHPDYIAEWAERFETGFGYAVAKMDGETFRRFVDLCEAHEGNALRYHPDAERG